MKRVFLSGILLLAVMVNAFGSEVIGTTKREAMFDGISKREAKFKLGLLDGVNWGRSFCRAGLDEGGGFTYEGVPSKSCDCYFLNAARYMTENEAEMAGEMFLPDQYNRPSESEKWIARQIFLVVGPIARSRCGI